MEIYTHTMTAPKPGIGMRTSGSACAPTTGARFVGTGVSIAAPLTGAVRAAVVVDRTRLEGDTAWRPPTS